MTTVAVAGQIFTFPIGLFQQANTKLLQTNPTLAAADFRKSINGGALLALDNTPTVTPAGGVQVQIVLSAAETAAAGVGGRIAVYWQDSVGAQWCDSGVTVWVYGAELATVGDAMTLTVAYNAAMTAAQAGDAMALTAGERVTLVAAIWTAAARTLTSFGALATTVAAAVWDRLTAAVVTVGSIGKYILDKLALITVGSVSVFGPVIAGGNVVTYRGDSYLDVDGRALEWQDDDFPDLTGATITVTIDDVAAFSGVAHAHDTALLELTAVQTLTIRQGRHNLHVRATRGALVATIVNATWVSRDPAGV